MHNFDDILIFIFAIWIICKTASRACSMVQPCKSTASNQRILPAFKSSKPYVAESRCDSLALLGLRPDLKQLEYRITQHVRCQDHLRQLHVSLAFVRRLFWYEVFYIGNIAVVDAFYTCNSLLKQMGIFHSSDSA